MDLRFWHAASLETGGAIDTSDLVGSILEEGVQASPAGDLVETVTSEIEGGADTYFYRKLWIKNHGAAPVSAPEFYVSEQSYPGQVSFALEKVADDSGVDNWTVPTGYDTSDFQSPNRAAAAVPLFADTSDLAAGASAALWVQVHVPAGMEPDPFATARLYVQNAAGDDDASLEIAYGVARTDPTEWEPTAAPVSPYTQIVGNKYPHHHAARRRKGSTIQRVINAITGAHMADMSRDIARLRASQFLPTVDLAERDLLYTCKDPTLDRQEPKSNLLVNAAFCRSGIARLRAPWAWTHAGISTGETELSTSNTLFGTHRVRLTADVAEIVQLRQRRDLVFAEGERVVAAVYYAGMAPSATTALVHRAYLAVVAQFTDATTRMWRVGLRPGTGGEWVRASVAVTMPRETHSVAVAVVIDGTDVSTPIVLDVGAFQLERGTSPGPWTEYVDEEPGFVEVSDRVAVTEVVNSESLTYYRASVRKVYLDRDYDALVYRRLPVRAIVSAAVDEAGVSAARHGFLVGQDGVRYSFGWRAEAGKAVRYNADISQDETWGEYFVADLYADGRYDEVWYTDVEDLGITQVVEAVTVIGDYLYVVAKETTQGRTVRALKICSPGVRWDDTGHIECLSDIRLDSGTGTCTYIGSIEGRGDRLLVTISAVDYVVDLVYDHATIVDSGKLIMLSEPAGQVVGR